ncbi:hypothetical protein B0H66DRAFT_546462 [Apodospora peruviana]|uniref:Uncharacterized protein n=1 Tax=Apodospora peruviana TaxID=516989 RepID=A0AAE0MG78_9PEZI|nr:hypothetical protein B0H66DRAFT_546462 [Apodospora peruviana]
MESNPTDQTQESFILLPPNSNFIYQTQKGRPVAVYHIDRTLDSLTHTDSAIHFDRVGKDNDSTALFDKEVNRRTRLFNLVHPVNAAYRKDEIPGSYYMTASSSNVRPSPGNWALETPPRSTLGLGGGKFEFYWSAGSTESSSPLFNWDDTTARPLFTATSKPVLSLGRGGGCVLWHSFGKEIAREEKEALTLEEGSAATTGNNNVPCYKMTITLQNREWVDTLVALWVLRLWHDIAEDSGFKRRGQY